jgi:GT2 family glycosyltransferase
MTAGAQLDRETTTPRATSMLRITVVIPTYLRPTWLVGCMQSLLQQTRLPHEVIAVMRVDDEATEQAFDDFVANRTTRAIAFRKTFVSEPGFLPPLRAGIAQAQGDIVAFLDDDAEALPDWLERLAAPYADEQVAGVGGRYVNYENGVQVIVPLARKVGRFHWHGTFEGNMYRALAQPGLREVDFFMGGNMSYRREVLERVQLDPALANDVAFHYEVDLGIQVKAAGGRLVYDPVAKIRHYSAPRAQAGMRAPDADTIYWYNHNTLYIALKHTRGFTRALAVAYAFAIGATRNWGVLAAVVDTLRRRRVQAWREIGPAFRGKARALRSHFARDAEGA